MTLKVALIIQARTGSKRLPGKVLMPVLGKPMFIRQIERLKAVKNCTVICVATTKKEQDDPIEILSKNENVLCFRGSEENVLERYYQAARLLKADVIVRSTADCPLIDPSIVEESIEIFLKKHLEIDFLANTLKRTYPRGMDCEIFSFNALKRVYCSAQSKYEKEHVTPYFYAHQNLFKCYSLEQKINCSDLNLSVDTKKDFLYVENIFNALYRENPLFGLESITNYLKKNEQTPSS